ncbi:hypothetical protein PHLGIDRAFT_228263 [Phlebiopsis gigantea 11061_1 CR5-6]|uniref:Uncharacterized protein n=1 Tax=Phlebiopsis gigantea (strain 11061_1 CR5-6) TaxID=745531 RepID=A0A0C3RT22_PHLG1|nr:hypothetical protein PHLGIDRAFT_228263 [Phlebiopsis gigantea 11061_1 CR5-6]
MERKIPVISTTENTMHRRSQPSKESEPMRSMPYNNSLLEDRYVCRRCQSLAFTVLAD